MLLQSSEKNVAANSPKAQLLLDVQSIHQSLKAQQLCSIPGSLFCFKNVIPTLETQTQKRLGTVKTRFYIEEMI